jgi:hypothetical protein
MLNNQSNISLGVEHLVKATYIGGHKAFPKQKHTKVAVYGNRLEIVELNLSIPYSSMINIENMDDKKISALRVVVLGLVFLPLAIVGALWKKKVLYTVIQYNDGVDEQTIILDLGKGVESIQPLIYQKMLLAKKLV